MREAAQEKAGAALLWRRLCLHTLHPPRIGDLLPLWDEHKRAGGCFRVVDREWHHPGFGSAVWPLTETAPKEGPSLTVIVEADLGIFYKEAPSVGQ